MDVCLTQYPSVLEMWSMMRAPKAASNADFSLYTDVAPFSRQDVNACTILVVRRDDSA